MYSNFSRDFNDRRHHDRLSRGDQIAMATTAHHQGPVRLLNLSRFGAAAEVMTSLEQSDWIRLEFTNGSEVAGVVRWIREDRFGIEFRKPLPADMTPRELLRRRVDRAPRFWTARRAEVEIRGRSFPVIIRNISERGIRIESTAELSIGQPVAIRCGASTPLEGTVQWSSAGNAGIRLAAPIDLDKFEAQTQQASLGREQGR
jgi:hypothetical protein